MKKRNKLSRKDIIKCTAVILSAVLIVSAILTGFYLWENRDYDRGDGDEAVFLEYDGKKHYLRNDVETVLVMGLDKFEVAVDNSAYYNDQCADFMMLLIFDHGNKTCSAIHINRDTMAEMSVLGKDGKEIRKVTKQITLAHSYGSGLADSCINTANAVSGLLCGIPIDYYISLTMDAIYTANDMVGGVTVTVLQDLTAHDPALQEGATVTLTAKQAEYYVRYRYGLYDSSNSARMERQRQYLTALYQKMMTVSESNENFSAEAAIKFTEYMVTNCNATKLDYFFDKAKEYEIKDIHTYTGESRINTYMEFYANEDDIKRIVTMLLCKTK